MKREPDRYAQLGRLVRARTDEEIREEFAHHLAARTEGYIAKGMTPGAAKDEAQRRLGDVERYVRETKEIDMRTMRERRRREWWDGVRREVRQAMRTLLRAPGFAAVAIVTLALGMGATGAIYTLLDAVVLRPLPYAQAERLVYVESEVSGAGRGPWGVSPAGFFNYRDNNHTLESVGIFATTAGSVSGDGEAERVAIAMVNAGLATSLGTRPALGRLLTADDDRPDAAHVVLLTHGFWMRRYGGDPTIVGRTILIDTSPWEVVGVLPAGLDLPERKTDIWRPLGLNPAGPFHNEHYLSLVARLKPGETLALARQDMERLTARFTELFPSVYPTSFVRDYHFAAGVMPLRDHVLGKAANTLWVLFASVALVLLIACANVANLFLVRAEVYRREVAVRSALGAERSHLVWHYMAESLLVTVLAAALGLGLAWGGIRLLPRAAPDALPRLEEVSLHLNTVLLMAGLAVVTGLLFGLFPLLRAARDAGLVLRESGRGLSALRRQNLVRAALVSGQVALALALLAAAGLMLRSFQRLRSVDPGLDPKGVVAIDLSLPYGHYKTWEQVNAFYEDFLTRVQALPGVQAAAVTTAVPIRDGDGCALVFAEDRPVKPGEQAPCLGNVLVSPGYFTVMGIKVDGHTPTWQENDAHAGAVVISGPLAKRFWANTDARNRGVRPNGPEPPYYRVAGVTADVRTHGLDEAPSEIVYYPLMPMPGAPLWSPPRGVALVVRTTVARPLTLLPDVRRVLAQMDPDIPLANVRSMEDIVAQSLGRTLFIMTLLGIAALMALLLSAVGIYGVISYIVGQRRVEIGIRMALGARSAAVGGMVVRQSLGVVVVGLAVGLGLTLASTRALRALLFDVSPSDPLTIVSATVVLMGIAVCASWAPARRAARVDPVEVMRAQ